MLNLNPFGCPHADYSFPQVIRGTEHHRKLRPPMGVRHYVVCLECGKEFPYDWSAMKVVKPVSEDDYVPLDEVNDACASMAA